MPCSAARWQRASSKPTGQPNGCGKASVITPLPRWFRPVRCDELMCVTSFYFACDQCHNQRRVHSTDFRIRLEPFGFEYLQVAPRNRQKKNKNRKKLQFVCVCVYEPAVTIGLFPVHVGGLCGPDRSSPSSSCRGEGVVRRAESLALSLSLCLWRWLLTISQGLFEIRQP